MREDQIYNLNNKLSDAEVDKIIRKRIWQFYNYLRKQEGKKPGTRIVDEGFYF